MSQKRNSKRRHMRYFASLVFCLYLLHSGLVELGLALMPVEEQTGICCATRDTDASCCCLPRDQNGEPVACDLNAIIGLAMRPAPCDSGSPIAFYGSSARTTVSHLIPTTIELNDPREHATAFFSRSRTAYSLHLDSPDKVPIVRLTSV